MELYSGKEIVFFLLEKVGFDRKYVEKYYYSYSNFTNEKYYW